ncbi:antibiotic biosynthesis monooxygenase [Vibrio kyushuensis]|uniref:putative quinol monooxygenase n=1 Tax=Vibrio kyushuensis TaxID=2910249 RepID=UPI003D113A87
MTTLFINAGLKLTADSDREFALEQLSLLVDETKKEPGCQYFELLANKEDSTTFTLWERWDNEQSLAEHFQKSHTKAYLNHNLTDVVYIEKLEAV